MPHRDSRTRAITGPACRLAVLALLVVACAPNKSDRVRLVEASALASQGQVEEAEAIFQEVLSENPTSADALLRYADFLLDTGELAQAERVLGRLDDAALAPADGARRHEQLIALHRARLERAEGEALHNPRDAAELEEALIALSNLDPGAPERRRLEEYWVGSAKGALGFRPDEPLSDDELAAIAHAPYPQVLPALVAVRKVVRGDSRLTHAPDPDAVERAEAARMLDALERRHFALTFDAEWQDRHEAELVRQGRYDRASRMLIAKVSGPPSPAATPESSESRLAFLAQTYQAREVVTELAYALRRAARGDAPPLPFRVEEFASVQVRGLEGVGGGSIRAELRIPYELVRRAVQLLDERQRQEAAASGGGD